jgi:hypothetical protein
MLMGSSSATNGRYLCPSSPSIHPPFLKVVHLRKTYAMLAGEEHIFTKAYSVTS